MYVNHAARLSANLLAAQCQDLGLGNIEKQPDGTCWAAIGPHDYHFGWDVMRQQVVMLNQVQVQLVVQEVAA